MRGERYGPRIVGMLAVGPATKVEICDELGISWDTFKHATNWIRFCGVDLTHKRVGATNFWRVTLPPIGSLALSDLVDSGAISRGRAAIICADHRARVGLQGGHRAQ